jgi:hypothetical protein
MNRQHPGVRTNSVDPYGDAVVRWLHEDDTNPAGMRILHAAHEPVTEAIPTWLLDSPATAEIPVVQPETVHRWEISWWMFVAGVAVGMVVMAILLRNL